MEIIGLILAILVPFGAAIWTIRSSAKDTAQQIAALEESTRKQIESIKELAKVQISVTRIQLYKELSDARHHFLLANKKEGDALEREHSRSMFGYVNEDIVYKEQERQDKMNNIAYEREFYSQQTKRITDSIKKLEEVEKVLKT